MRAALVLLFLLASGAVSAQERPTDEASLKALYDGHLFMTWCRERGVDIGDAFIERVAASGAAISERMDNETMRVGLWQAALHELPYHTEFAQQYGVEYQCREGVGSVLQVIRGIGDETYSSEPPF